MVGGTGGTDSQLVAFRASPDERVTIQTPAQQRSSGGLSIGTINLHGIADVADFARKLQDYLRMNPGALSPSFSRPG